MFGPNRANPRGTVMRHLMFRTALAVLAASAAFGDGAALAASAAQGKVAFMKYGCWQCHGTQGHGSVASNGKVLAPDPLPYESFSAFVRPTNGAMPPYSELVVHGSGLPTVYRLIEPLCERALAAVALDDNARRSRLLAQLAITLDSSVRVLMVSNVSGDTAALGTTP